MAITNVYTTGSAVKAALGIIDSDSDTQLDLVIESVSRLIDDYTGRFFYSAGTTTAYYEADQYLTLPIDDFVSVSSLTMTQTARMKLLGEPQTIRLCRITLLLQVDHST